MYATVEQLTRYLSDVYNQLYDDDQYATDDLEAASSEIDGGLGVRYQTPVTSSTVLPMLRTWALALAAELAWGRSAQAEPPPNLAKRCADIRKRLAEYEAGDRTLAADPVTDASTGAAGAALVQGDDPQFTKTKLAGW